MYLGVLCEIVANSSESTPPTNAAHEKPTANATTLAGFRRWRSRRIETPHSNITIAEKTIDVWTTRESFPMIAKLATPIPDAPR
jgi:hypothetical protein